DELRDAQFIEQARSRGLATGALEELRIAQFFHKRSSACAGPGRGADSPRGVRGSAPAQRLTPPS
ncbi:hypothetical protein, partial [Polyangium jinanense]